MGVVFLVLTHPLKVRRTLFWVKRPVSQATAVMERCPSRFWLRYGEVKASRDRDGCFSPRTVTVLAEGKADQIIGMYAFDISSREVSCYFEREFNTRLSAGTISAMTDRVLSEIQERKSCSQDPVYAICGLDAIHYKVKDDGGRAVTRLRLKI